MSEWDRPHRCRDCGWVHVSGGMQADRIVSMLLVSALAIAGAVAMLGGCAHRDAKPDNHPGAHAVDRLIYCRDHHGGAHLPVDQEGCERW